MANDNQQLEKEIKDFIEICRSGQISEERAINLWSTGSRSDEDRNKGIQAIKAARLSTSGYTSTNNGRPVKADVKTLSLVDTLKSIMSAQEYTQWMPGLENELFKVDDAFSLILNKKDDLYSLKSPKEIFTTAIEMGLDRIEDYFKEQSALLTIINEKAGLTGEYSEAYREELTKANPELIQLGIGFNDLSESAQNLITQSGKFATINADTWVRAGEVSKAYVGTLQNLVAMYPEFEKVGLGAADAQERIGAAGKAALNLGLQAQKATKDLSTNIGKLNEYGFKNGIDGLAAMTRKATEFRMSMDEVFKIADKVMNPEGAIDLAANLQVLGGAIGDFNDPLKLMYMATNNVEGLQDALIDATGGLALFNEEQGRFEITGINLRKAKAMADALGVSYGEFSKGAIAAAERSRAASDLAARGLTLTDEQREFITNISQMKGGKMTIELNSEKLQNEFGAKEVALEDLTQKQLAQLTQFQDEFKKMSAEDVARKQATDVENMRRDISAIAKVVTAQAGVFLTDQSKNLTKKITGEENLSVFTNNMANNAINKMTGTGKEFSEQVKKAIDNLWDPTKRNKPTTKPTGGAAGTTETSTEETTNTGTTTTKKKTAASSASAPQESNAPLMAFNTEAITNLVTLNTKQDGLITNTLNTATNTEKTSINIQNLGNQLTTYLNTLTYQTKSTSPISADDIGNIYAKLAAIDKKKIDDNLITQKANATNTVDKKEISTNSVVKITLSADDSAVDKVARSSREMLLSSPELSGKLVDKLSYLSVGYV